MDASDVDIDVETLWPTVEWTLTARRPGRTENESQARGGGAPVETPPLRPDASICGWSMAFNGPWTIEKKNHMWYHWWYVGTWFVPEGKAAAEEILFYSDLRSKGSVDISPIRFITCDFVGRIVTDQATPTRPCRYPIGRLAPRPLSPVPVNKSTMIIKRENWPRFFW